MVMLNVSYGNLNGDDEAVFLSFAYGRSFQYPSLVTGERSEPLRRPPVTTT